MVFHPSPYLPPAKPPDRGQQPEYGEADRQARVVLERLQKVQNSPARPEAIASILSCLDLPRDGPELHPVRSAEELFGTTGAP